MLAQSVPSDSFQDAEMFLRAGGQKGQSTTALVDAVVEGLCALQCGDGSWNAEGVYEAKPEGTAETRLDVTAEFVALLSQMKAVSDV